MGSAQLSLIQRTLVVRRGRMRSFVRAALRESKPMSITLTSERRLLADDEFEPLVRSHYPLIEDLSHQELVELAKWLRGRRDRARDIVRARRRVARGKVAVRGTATETASERGLSAKKQVFVNALRRVNSRLARLRAAAHRAQTKERLQAALGRKQAAMPHHPQPGPTASTGMRVNESGRRRRVLQAARIGRVSQSVRDAQATRDTRAT